MFPTLHNGQTSSRKRNHVGKQQLCDAHLCVCANWLILKGFPLYSPTQHAACLWHDEFDGILPKLLQIIATVVAVGYIAGGLAAA